MLNKINWKSVGKNIIIVAIYIVMTITMMGFGGEIFEGFEFDEGLFNGFKHMWKELSTDEGYATTTIIICTAYCYAKLTKRIAKLFARKEKKEES